MKAYLLDVAPSFDSAQEAHSLLGLGELLDFVGHDQRQFWHVFHHVALAHDQSRHATGGHCGDNGVTPLVDVDAAVPTAPGLRWGEHATTTTHVTKSTLSGAVSTAAPDAGNTRHCAPGAPRLRRSLMTYEQKKAFC